MDDAQALLTKVFEAYNRRDFATLLSFLTPDIDWPDQVNGGRLVGLEAVKAYWDDYSRSIQVDLAPMTFTALPDGRIAVDTNRIVRNLSGQIWSDSHVRQIFTLRGDKVARLDVEFPDKER